MGPAQLNGVYLAGLQLGRHRRGSKYLCRNYSTRAEDGTVYTGGTVNGVVQAFGADKASPFVYTIWDAMASTTD